MAKPYFVYELVDPRCGSVFYVGKGKGNRPYQHRKQAEAGVTGRKCDRIRQILAEGVEPKVRIVKRFADELDAYAEEVFHIANIGIENLTNVCIGGVGAVMPRDPVKEARDVVRGCLGAMRKAVVMEFAGLRVIVCGHDITDTVRDTVAKLKDRAGAEWFDGVVGVPRWQPA